MSEWMPIESCPRDGTAMIVYGEELRFPQLESGSPLNAPRGAVVGKGAAVVGLGMFSPILGWWTHAISSKGKACALEPSHWMSLPERPQEKEPR